MTTKAEKIAQLKLEYPTLREGSDEDGYIELNKTQYEKTIELWADNILNQEAEEKLKAENKASLLSKLGITEDEAKLLLS